MDFSSSSGYQKFKDSDRKTNDAFTAQRQAQDFEMSNVTVVPDGECHQLYDVGNPIIIVRPVCFPTETYTVAQAVDAFGFGKFQVKLSLFTGLCWMADSMETTILSILSPTLHYEWQITRLQQAVATTVSMPSYLCSL